ncbi:MAG: TIGR00730 family Rossman fold protein [Clostridiales bacterium]|nr:MAG: TIGR00730 family Rossman fold protein [Clostridiales bacterium]
MRICVYGAASTELAEYYLRDAFLLGKSLADKGIGLVFGGGATGVMGELARGAAAGGGEIIGVSPQFFQADGVLYDHCTQLIYTETMRQRKQKMEELADAFIMLPGGMGTLEEFFEILTLKQLGRHTKSIAVLNTHGYYDALQVWMEQAIAEGFMREACRTLYFISNRIEDVLQYVCVEQEQPPRILADYKAVRMQENLTEK